MFCLGPESEVLHRRYAQALMGLAEESGRLDEIADNIERLYTLVSGDRELSKMLFHPEIPREEKKELLQKIGKAAGLCEEFCLFVKLLIDKRRFNILHGILLKYRDLYDIRRGRQKVCVSTAAALSTSQQERLKGILDKMLNKKVIIEQTTVPSLIGGINIRIGSRAYNLSMADRLRFVKEALAV